MIPIYKLAFSSHELCSDISEYYICKENPAVSRYTAILPPAWRFADSDRVGQIAPWPVNLDELLDMFPLLHSRDCRSGMKS